MGAVYALVRDVPAAGRAAGLVGAAIIDVLSATVA
jgi:hypothetical protein